MPALVPQGGVGDLPAFAAGADDLALGNANVGEKHLVEFGSAGHGPKRPHLDPRRLHREEQVTDAGVLLGVGLGADEAEHHVRRAAVEVQIFWPLMRKSSPSSVARVESEARSLPDPGSE